MRLKPPAPSGRARARGGAFVGERGGRLRWLRAVSGSFALERRAQDDSGKQTTAGSFDSAQDDSVKQATEKNRQRRRTDNDEEQTTARAGAKDPTALGVRGE
jgi:hypothetical protein